MTMIWRKVAHKGDESYAYCGRKDGDRFVERCNQYQEGCLCRECKYVSGKVLEEEREEE